MANSKDCLSHPHILTRGGFSVSSFLVYFAVSFFAAFFCVTSVLADYNAATADLSAAWTVTSSNGITLDGNNMSSANHTGTLTINSDPTITLTNGAVFEQSGNFTSGNHKAIVVKGGGTLKITSAGSLNSQDNGLWGFYIYDDSVVDTTGAGYICFYGQADALQLYGKSEFIIGTNFWTKRNSVVHVYNGADAKISQSTATGISDASGLNLSTSGSITFTVESNATLTSTVRIYDEGSSKGFTKNGSGTMTILNANNDFKKGTAISEGKLVLSKAGNLTATSGVSIASGATLEFKDSDSDGEGGTITFNRIISGAGNVVKSGTGTVNLSASNSYTGTTTISGGTLHASGVSGNNITALGTGALTINNATLSLVKGSLQASSVTIAGESVIQSTATWNRVKNLSGSGVLTLIGSDTGYLAINGDYFAKNFTGTINVGSTDTAGGLSLEANNILNAAATIRAKNGWINWNAFNQSFGSFEYLDGEMRNMTGTLTLGNEFKYNSSADLTVPCLIAGSAKLTKEGSGSLTLSGANTYSGETTVSAGTLKLIDDALENAHGDFTVGENGRLEFYVDEGQTKTLTASEQNALFINGKVIKTGAGELKIDAADPGSVDAQSLVVSSGRLDMKEYFKGQLEVENGTFSPGNSVGALTIDSQDIAAIDDSIFGIGFILCEEDAALLMEIGGSNVDDNDVLIVQNGNIVLGSGIIELAMTGDCTLGLGESFTAVLSAENSEGLNVLAHIQTSDFTDLKYVPIDGGLYAITGRRFNANEVPEPSTWALLALGVVVLFLRKRVRN